MLTRRSLSSGCDTEECVAIAKELQVADAELIDGWYELDPEFRASVRRVVRRAIEYRRRRLAAAQVRPPQIGLRLIVGSSSQVASPSPALEDGHAR